MADRTPAEILVARLSGVDDPAERVRIVADALEAARVSVLEHVRDVVEHSIENGGAMHQYGGAEGRLRELAALYIGEAAELCWLDDREAEARARAARIREVIADVERLTGGDRG